MTPYHYLIVPGWQGSGEQHWQSYWQHYLPNYQRVEVADWQQPQRQDWVPALDQAIRRCQGPVILIAHSLGCISTAHWAATASVSQRQKVKGALLVAPADVERAGCPEALRPFAPIPTAALPFATQVVGSSNDYAASEARARELARLWGADVAILPGAGHINVASGHHRWSEGLVWLDQLEQHLDQQRSPWQRMAS